MRMILWAAFLLLTPCAWGDDLAKYDARITAEDRAHWAFQPVRRPQIPKVKDASWCRNPIDRFVLARLEEMGWTPSPSPAPLALLRRIHFDVTGLPATIEEQDALLRDSSPEAIDRVVDDLLARPAYGERWARHWLDVVRFAESNGFERDATKPYTWRYRDWVIRAFNDDMSYDRFLLEQIAGDELPDATADTLIATGFHRLGPWDDEPADPKQDRFDQLDDMVATTSEAFLGLTLGCARCHDHKFEPLTSLDYTRLVAVFAPLQRPREGRTELDLPAGSRAQLEALAARDRRIGTVQQTIEALRAGAGAAFLNSPECAFPARAREAFRTNPTARSAAQRRLVTEHLAAFERGLAARMSDEDRVAVRRHEEEIRREHEETPDLPRGYFLREPSHEAPVTHLLARGQATSPGPVVGPGVPAVLASSQPDFFRHDGQTTRRRLTLARWLTGPEHPLTARVIVNRIWQFHCGEGLVRTPNDFGTAGDPPTHPELLDWLADWFVTEGQWSLKRLHRLILESNSARMARTHRADHAAEDPEDRLLWRMPYRRLEVEAIRDAILSSSGQLNLEMYGPSMFPPVPRGALEGSSDPDKIWKSSSEREASRRTIYAFVKRSMVIPMIEVLDFCDTTRSAPKRLVTSTATQALALFNGDFVALQSAHFADRLMREAGEEPAAQVERAYRLALGRPPKPGEVAAMTKFLSRETGAAAGEHPTSAALAGARRKALARMGRVIFNLNEFAYPD
jgi:hypothetical protein